MDDRQEVLDLSLIFTQPSLGSPPEILAHVIVQCDALGLSHTGKVFADPLTKTEREDLRWYLEEYWQWPYLEFAERGKRVEALLNEVGKRLYQALFGSHEAQNIIQVWQQRMGVHHQISVVSEIASILRLPWELLADSQGFLVLHADHPISLVRRLPTKGEQASLPLPFQLPLRVLLVTARPEDAGFVDPRSIGRKLVDELQKQSEAGTIEMEFLRPPTFSALRTRLKNTERPIHVLHFDGHGELDRKEQQGVLLFETRAGKQSRVKASDVAKVLSKSGVRLAVLTACQSAMNIEDDGFSSVATQLINNGLDAVIAMSSSILVTSAALYAEAFYHALAEGLPVSMAQEQARQALQRDPRRHLFSRRQDEEAAPVTLADWWVPHFYQQRPLTLRVTATPRKYLPEPDTTFPRFNKDMPQEPRYQFSGRARELLQIERHLLRGKLVVISGFGGVGKTAFAREAADWLTRTGLYTGACFISFEGGRASATNLLSQIGFFLGIYDGTYTPDDPKAALSRLQATLKEQRSLVIADNLESILPGGEAPLETSERNRLWDMLLDLQQLGVGVLLTTQTTAFRDERLAEGARVVYLQLEGLGCDDAYQLASNLLTILRIDRRRAPYQPLRELLRQLGHHPLSIHLVLPALRTYGLAQIQQDFVALLPRFTDDMERGHNRSLLASLEYSLQRLNKKQRKLLSRLVVFESRASELSLLAVTEIAEADWAELREALEQTALLVVTQLEGMKFLRFHPILIPYLRGQFGTQDEMLELWYAQWYYQTSEYYYREDSRYPIPVRGLVLWELPNLRRAFGWLLEGGYLEEAAEMARTIDQFLGYFGLHREQQQMHQRIAAALATQKQSFVGTLTQAEYLHETNLGEEELRDGRLQEAHARLQHLLTCIESQPEGNPRGPGSFEHVVTLSRLGHYLETEGNFSEALQIYQRVITLNEALLQHNPEDQDALREQAVHLANLGDALLRQGQYAEAKKAHEQALQIDERFGNQRGQNVSRLQLGTIALNQGDYPEARRRYQQSLSAFHALGESAMEAVVWYQLGRVAQEEQNWPEAERCCRESLLLKVQLGDRVGAARTCNLLGSVALLTHRFEEAKGWYRHAVMHGQQTDPTSGDYAGHLFNLANCLTKEVQTGTVQERSLQLEEAQRYAEQSLAIDQVLHSPDLWQTFSLLATIADIQGRHEAVHANRRQERDVFARFAGHRYRIDQRFGKLFPHLAAALDNLQVRAQMEKHLSQLEAKGWHISEALHHIWAGERDWQTLVEKLGNQEALFVLRVLETIAALGEKAYAQLAPEAILASFPTPVQEALQQGDQTAFARALMALPSEEQLRVLAALRALQDLTEESKPEQGE